MQERAQSEETWEVHVAEQCWLDWMEKESPISKPLDAPNWHVWDTWSLLQKEMEVGTAYQELVLESLEKEISCYSSRGRNRKHHRNFCVGDIIILNVDTQHNDWRLAKVIQVYKDEKGYVWTVQFHLGYSDPAKSISCMLVHPIDKFVLLVDSVEEVQSLTEEHHNNIQ